MDDGAGHQLRNGPLDPLLRELLDFGVVELDPAGDWRLIESAQRRLRELAAPRPPDEKIIFFGHRCSSCGQLRPTRLDTHGLVCDECRRAPTNSRSDPIAGSPRGMTA